MMNMEAWAKLPLLVRLMAAPVFFWIGFVFAGSAFAVVCLLGGAEWSTTRAIAAIGGLVAGGICLMASIAVECDR